MLKIINTERVEEVLESKEGVILAPNTYRLILKDHADNEYSLLISRELAESINDIIEMILNP